MVVVPPTRIIITCRGVCVRNVNTRFYAKVLKNITTVEYDEYTEHGGAYELLFFFFFGSDTRNNILKLSFSIYAHGNS